MKTIHKYILEITDSQIIQAPSIFCALTAQFQNNKLCLWAAVKTDSEIIEHEIIIIGTGNLMPDILLRYIATVQQAEFVWHIFLKPEINSCPTTV